MIGVLRRNEDLGVRIESRFDGSDNATGLHGDRRNVVVAIIAAIIVVVLVLGVSRVQFGFFFAGLSRLKRSWGRLKVEHGFKAFRVAATAIAVKARVAKLTEEERINLRVDEEVEVDDGKELDFKRVHFFRRDTTDFGIESVVEVVIIKKLCRAHETGEQKTMNTQRINLEVRTVVQNAIQVH